MRLSAYFILFSITLFHACRLENKPQQMPNSSPKANSLINESSPYLLQHAYNPVDWQAWGDAALMQAKKENKPLLISIGYSACHWCHVMEHESFEDSAVAEIMNEHFICIKVDREERPDIDQIYMDAVQLMTGRGGWPLNCFATPEGKPFFGGTYFPKENWKKILLQLADLYKNDPKKVEEYAQKLTEGIQNSDQLIKSPIQEKFDLKGLKEGLGNWRKNFDPKDGGNDYAPKFPMPNTYQFMLRYAYLEKDQALMEHVNLSLKKMAYGGIYDQIGGGFARYSTDMEWKVPHFEKMLYDNAQLIGLYSEAYRQNPNPLYKQVVEESIAFLQKELRDEKGIYYSALDADSEGEEGKYYVWKLDELKSILGDDFELAQDYFNFNDRGFWEHGNYIPLRNNDNSSLASAANISLKDYEKKIEQIKEQLLQVRARRIKPGLDDKSLCSWNALLISAYVEAYFSFGEKSYLDEAQQIAQFILDHMRREDGGLFHSYKAGKSTINGYLEDYSFSIEALIQLYEASFDSVYLKEAERLLSYSIAHFYDNKSAYFFFSSDLDSPLISRKIERSDNVIPASNSSMAKALFKLGLLLDKKAYTEMAEQMLSNQLENISRYLPGNTNWAQLLLYKSKSYYEVAIVGEKADSLRSEIQARFIPNALFLGAIENSSLPLLANKYDPAQSLIYVCENKACQLPTPAVEQALKQIIF